MSKTYWEYCYFTVQLHCLLVRRTKEPHHNVEKPQRWANSIHFQFSFSNGLQEAVSRWLCTLVAFIWMSCEYTLNLKFHWMDGEHISWQLSHQWCATDRVKHWQTSNGVKTMHAFFSIYSLKHENQHVFQNLHCAWRVCKAMNRNLEVSLTFGAGL